MITKPKVISALFLLAISTAAAIGLLFGQTKQEVEPPRVAPLVQQLGNDQFTLRQSATRELHEIGEPAIPALMAAAIHSDQTEIRWRAKQLIHSILMFSKSTAMESVFLEAGEFQMGSSADEKNRRADEQDHRVRITKPFLLGKYEVTQQEFSRVMKYNPSRFAKVASGPAGAAGPDPRYYPVEGVSWFDAVEFCNRLSELDKFPPYYRVSDVKKDGESVVSADVVVRGGPGYRLPTEAEWEYACRAGAKTRFYFGNANTGREANVKPEMTTGGYGGPSARWRDHSRPTEVGTFPPNAWGLADMHGNVGEWCWDRYDKDFYASSPSEDPLGPTAGTARVLRGGSWLMQEEHARSASRMYFTPEDRKDFVGFRIARTPELTLEAHRYLSSKDNR